MKKVIHALLYFVDDLVNHKIICRFKKDWRYHGNGFCSFVERFEDHSYIPEGGFVIMNEESKWGDRIDDEGTEIDIIDSEDQLLAFRVGPVWTSKEISDVPGIWINYQSERGKSEYLGPFLMSPEMWRWLSKEIEKRLLEFSPDKYHIPRTE